jgi:hypothetical protein
MVLARPVRQAIKLNLMERFPLKRMKFFNDPDFRRDPVSQDESPEPLVYNARGGECFTLFVGWEKELRIYLRCFTVRPDQDRIAIEIPQSILRPAGLSGLLVFDEDDNAFIVVNHDGRSCKFQVAIDQDNDTVTIPHEEIIASGNNAEDIAEKMVWMITSIIAVNGESNTDSRGGQRLYPRHRHSMRNAMRSLNADWMEGQIVVRSRILRITNTSFVL